MFAPFALLSRPSSLRSRPSLSFPVALVILKEQHRALELPSSFTPLFPLAGRLVHHARHCRHPPSTLSLTATCVVPGVNRSGSPAVSGTLPPRLTECTTHGLASEHRQVERKHACKGKLTCALMHRAPIYTTNNSKKKSGK